MVELITVAQRFSPKRGYQPEASPDYPMHQAIAAASQASVYEWLATITADVAGVPVAFHTATGARNAAVYLLAIYVETTGTTAASGSITVTLRWSWNDPGDSKAEGDSATCVTSLVTGNINSVNIIAVDAGTTLTWEYAVTGFTTGSADVKMAVSLTQLL